MSLEAGQPLDGLFRSIMVIVVSEIGDKTFLIAAILSMRYPRVTVFAGSLSALAVMSLLSSVMGTIMPAILPKKYTTAAAAVLFFVFGARMLQEGLEMEAGERGREKMDEEFREVQKEVEEVEAEVVGRSSSAQSTYALDNLEEGRAPSPAAPPRSGAASPVAGGTPPVRPPSANRARKNSLSKDAAVKSVRDGVRNLAHLLFSPIFIQAFIMTFLAEWGDRSQIATIALAAAHNVWLITAGTTFGHSLCTALAVVSGRWVSQHISIKHVTLGGAVLFLIFGMVYSYEAYYWVDEPLQLVIP